MYDARYIIIEAKNVPGFQAVVQGEQVDTEFLEKGIVKLCRSALRDNKNIKAIFLECKELTCYSEALRFKTGLPVFDAITSCDFLMSSFQANPYHDPQSPGRGVQRVHRVKQSEDPSETPSFRHVHFKNHSQRHQISNNPHG